MACWLLCSYPHGVAHVPLPLWVAMQARSCSITPTDQQLIYYTLGLAVVHYPHGAALVLLALWAATQARLCSVTPWVNNRSITPTVSYSVTRTMSSSCSLRPAEPSSVWPAGLQLQPQTICGSPLSSSPAQHLLALVSLFSMNVSSP
ncbi:uncharacterized protein LACBIDRAFT_334210 [Laccaria bicolor S238N-H82]|uniref:Predicted protein n=1 Tax=Laccaria bicolor (strain S238N-H82 / ATCC MYA-4686) TaxID=486041 RepID=B0DYH0_LACBS|nr:uncharacterized protein LACBIDRAFT_334210 [Laccaria bicolor S238N-H82]EDR00437.1 predicted protein [Laccaria bicolor S238N-H82]|eukprot:XP_001888996.1 predicted protein [Laccaria bicolor S238N-H82]